LNWLVTPARLTPLMVSSPRTRFRPVSSFVPETEQVMVVAGGLLVHGALAAIGVVVLKMSEGRRRGDRVHVLVTMVVKRDVQEGVVGQAHDEVADVFGLGGSQLGKHGLDPSLVLLGGFHGLRCVTGN
jgi:hypothetical protein